ncbi:MAG: carbon-nitrogen hydrolase family protein [Acidobacteria bacterium]|nr:carbon-nitrogen hydrolase family protein [Acidobacteriota bacterium]
MKLAVILMILSGISQAQERSVRVAVCQIFSIDGDREGNFRRIEYALEQARAAKADIAAFPESVLLGWENPEAHQMATPIPGADSDRIAALARQYGVMISIGLDEKDGDRLYDSAILVDRTGKLLWKHRKLNVLAHLMDPPYSEGTIDGVGVVETEFGRIGLVICADTFKDEIAKRIEAMAPDLMLVPYGWAAPMDQWPGHAKELEKLVKARAARWKCPVVGTDLVGQMSHGPWKGQTYGGASVAVDAGGQVLHVLRDRDAEVRTVTLQLPPARKAASR